MTEQRIHIFGGGTLFHVRPHLALAAPAYGTVARSIFSELSEASGGARDGGSRGFKHELLDDPGRTVYSTLHLTKMADPRSLLETNADIERRIDELLADPETRVIFMSAALCDFEGHIVNSGGPQQDPRYDLDECMPSGKDQPRLKSRDPGYYEMALTASAKLIGKIRKERKDIFLVGFKTTAGASPDEQYLAGLGLLKGSSCNLVLANDVHTRLNMVITPEQARYHETTDRAQAIRGLVEMTLLRSKLHFTRSTIVPGEPVSWNGDMVPESLRKVVDHCIARGAYKPFNGATVGHFAYKLDSTRFVTSRRKVDFNKLPEIGMVLVESKGPGEVIAHGHRPSVGGMSQRMVFTDHPEVDCIVHFHCPLRKVPWDNVAVREQRPFECGSHECGQNTSDGLGEVGFEGIKAVMLDQHGPNIVFPKSADPARVIDFIERNFDLTGRTDGVAAMAGA